MKLKSSAMLIAIVLAILISGAVTAVSRLVLINKNTASRLVLSKIAYYNAYGAMQEGLKSYGKVIDSQKFVDNLGRKNSNSRTSENLEIDTEYYLSINQVSIGKTKDGSGLGPASEDSPRLADSQKLTYFMKPDQEIEFFWSKLKRGDAESAEEAQISFELVGHDGRALREIVPTRGSFHKNITGCTGEKNDFCELRINIKPATSKGVAGQSYINYSINPNDNYGNMTNFSMISIGRAQAGDGLIVEKKLIARFDLISKNLINIMEYDRKNSEK